MTNWMPISIQVATRDWWRLSSPLFFLSRLKATKMRFFFKRWLDFETKWGDEQSRCPRSTSAPKNQPHRMWGIGICWNSWLHTVHKEMHTTFQIDQIVCYKLWGGRKVAWSSVVFCLPRIVLKHGIRNDIQEVPCTKQENWEINALGLQKNPHQAPLRDLREKRSKQ